LERQRRNSNTYRGSIMKVELSIEEAIALATALANTTGAEAARAFVLLENRIIAVQEKANEQG